MSIWDETEVNKYYILEQLTDEDIQNAEQFFNVKLPKEFIDLLKIQNGGYLKKKRLPVHFKNDLANDHIPFDVLFGVKEKKGIMESKYLLKEWGIKEKNLILLSGDGHFWIALDYRNDNKNPEIVYIDTTEQKITKIYDSFNEMINNLYEEPANEINLDQIEEKPLEEEIEKAYKLMESNKKIDVLEGMSLRVFGSGLSFPDEKFIDKLMSFLIHEDFDLRMTATEYFSRYISLGFIKDKNLIKRILSIIENEEDSDMQYFCESIKKHM